MDIHKNTNILKYTLIGLGAPLIWASYALIAVKLSHLPKFEVVGLAFLACSIILTFTKIKSRPLKSLPVPILIAGVLGICVNQICYLSAFKFAPPAHADLINYLWPILILFGSMLLPDEKFKLKSLIAGLIAFFGIALLINSDCSESISSTHIIGYCFALAAALSWTIFNLSIKYYSISIKSILRNFCIIGFILAFVLHIIFEKFMMPTFVEWIQILIGGGGALGIAYICWDLGMRKGNSSFLALASYSIPILSIALLIIFGYVEYTNKILIATAFVTVASTFSASGSH